MRGLTLSNEAVYRYEESPFLRVLPGLTRHLILTGNQYSMGLRVEPAMTRRITASTFLSFHFLKN